MPVPAPPTLVKDRLSDVTVKSDGSIRLTAISDDELGACVKHEERVVVLRLEILKHVLWNNT